MTAPHLDSSPAAKLQEVLRVPPEEGEEGREDLTFNSSYKNIFFMFEVAGRMRTVQQYYQGYQGFI